MNKKIIVISLIIALVCGAVVGGVVFSSGNITSENINSSVQNTSFNNVDSNNTSDLETVDNIDKNYDKIDSSLRSETIDLINNDGYPPLQGVNSYNGHLYDDTDYDRANNENNPYCEDYSLKDNVSMEGQQVFIYN